MAYHDKDEKIVLRVVPDTGSFRASPAGVWEPPADILESETQIQIRLDIAGLDEGAIDVSFREGVLSISGKRIHLSQLKYWSVQRQEAYATPQIAFERCGPEQTDHGDIGSE